METASEVKNIWLPKVGEIVLHGCEVRTVKSIDSDCPGYLYLEDDGCRTLTQFNYCFKPTDIGITFTRGLDAIRLDLLRRCHSLCGHNLQTYFERRWMEGLHAITNDDHGKLIHIVDRVLDFCNNVTNAYHIEIDGIKIFR